MSPIKRYRWLSFHLMIFAFGGLILFLYGFFPLKYHGGAESSWNDLPSDINGFSVDAKKLYIGNRTRVVLMVIDALRYDFVSAKYMPFTTQMINNKSACLYKAQAQPPTVTMPRIKAMTTGSVSNFIDVALNFGSSAVTEDSFLHQAKLNNKQTVFYGDDTWLRLFPDAFKRSEGTTSFFVSDYTEVDLNVTRHLDTELVSSAEGPDWDLMVLHYLGLDHIGHLEGPASDKVVPKMAEMDTVVRRIVETANNWKGNTVLVVCGDHGMKDSGSHGGASHSEVTVPLVITQQNGCFDKYPLEVDQVDIAPTVSYLLGLPIPSASTGQILPQVLGDGIKGDLSTRKALYALHYNARMNVEALFKILGTKEASTKDCYNHYTSAVKYHHDVLTGGSTSTKMTATLYLSSLNNMAKYLNESVVEFDMFAIIIGIIIILQTFITQVLVMIISYQPKTLEQYPKYDGFKKPGSMLRRVVAVMIVFAFCVSIFLLSCGVTQTNSSLCKAYPLSAATVATIIVVIVSNTALIIYFLRDINKSNELSHLNPIELFLVIGTIIQALTFGGTSFIEEEHQTWYFFWVSVEFFVLVYTGSVLVDYIRKRIENATEIQDKTDLAYKMDVTGKWLLPQWVFLMLLHRFLRTLNQTGDKWAFLPDTGDWLNEEEHKNILSPIAIIAIACIGFICLNNLDQANNLFKINTMLTVVATLCIFCYRITTLSIQVPFYFPALSDVLIVRIFWLAIFSMMVIDISSAANYLNKNKTKTVSKYKDDMKCENVSYLGQNASVYVQPNKSKHRNVDSDSSGYYSPEAHPTSRLLSVSEGSGSTEPCVKMQILTSRTNTFLNIMILVCSLLLRPHNLILVPSIYMTSKVTNDILDYKLGSRIFRIDMAKEESESKNIFCKTIFHIWIGAVFYFYQGNSNSLASIDLGSGYIGLQSYMPVVVALQMGIHTYTGPLLSGLFLFVDCVQKNKQYDRFMIHIGECVSTISVLRIYPLVVYTIITALLRYHLFVWTVFSPKLLYDFMLMYFSLSSILTMIIMCKSVTLQEKFNDLLKRSEYQQRDESYQPKEL